MPPPKLMPTQHDILHPPQLSSGKLVNECQTNGESASGNSQENKSKAGKKSTHNLKTGDQIDNDYPSDAETLVAKQSSFKKEKSATYMVNVQGKGKGKGEDLGD